MSRPLRIEFPGALYHVTARGNERRDTFRDDADRRRFLDLLGETVRRSGWIITAYVLMTNHFHIVLQLTTTTLSSGMKWLNGKYAQAFNKRHQRSGHLFQGRFDARLIERERYLLNVVRYDILNPVRAAMVGKADDYEWSSYRATVGLAPGPEWLAAHEVLMMFNTDPVVGRACFNDFVQSPIARDDKPWADVVGQLYLGSDEWVERMRERVASRLVDAEHPRDQRCVGRWLMSDVLRSVAAALGVDVNSVRLGRGGTARMLAAWLGCFEAMLSLSEIAAALRVRSAGYVSRLIRECDNRLSTDPALRRDADRCRALLHRL